MVFDLGTDECTEARIGDDLNDCACEYATIDNGTCVCTSIIQVMRSSGHCECLIFGWHSLVRCIVSYCAFVFVVVPLIVLLVCLIYKYRKRKKQVNFAPETTSSDSGLPDYDDLPPPAYEEAKI